MPHNCLHFPVALKYQGHDELDVLEDSEALTALLCNSNHLLPHDDVFIDSLGHVYTLNEQRQLERTEQHYTVESFNSLMQRHFFALANACVAKAATDSIATGMLAILASTDR